MKGKLLTAVSILFVFLPWTILPLRRNDWALESPAAEIILSAYAALMIAGGFYTLLCYLRLRLQTLPMKVSLLVNGLYAAAGAAVLAMIFLPG